MIKLKKTELIRDRNFKEFCALEYGIMKNELIEIFQNDSKYLFELMCHWYQSRWYCPDEKVRKKVKKAIINKKFE